MCQNAPDWRGGRLAAGLLACLVVVSAYAQSQPSAARSIRPDWRRIGDFSFDAGLASPASGQVDRVWFSEDGLQLYARAPDGSVFVTGDFETWRATPAGLGAAAPDPLPVWPASALPELNSQVRPGRLSRARLYAFSRKVYRSDDGGAHWVDLTSYRGQSIIGEGVLDLAVSPVDDDSIVAANHYGVWRSVDGGLSWYGLNDNLPNLPVSRLLETPQGSNGARILLSAGGSFEWAPGEKRAWRPAPSAVGALQADERRSASVLLGAEVTAVAIGLEYSYAGGADGRLWVSRDQGETWTLSRPEGARPVEEIYVHPGRPTLAVAAFGRSAEGSDGVRVLRTLDGGAVWDDLTGDMPASAVFGVAADPAGTALYAASDHGAFFSQVDLSVAGAPPRWIPMSQNLPQVPVMDVRLDEAGNQVYLALSGYGVYAAPAPHRFWNLQVVSPADFSRRPAAPGSLLTVLGGRLVRAQAGLLEAPVLDASETQSQIQIPFEVTGQSTDLALELAGGQFTMSLPLQNASPAIFVDHDGSPLLLDSDGGVLLDALTPAKAGSRVQILATGLGRVQPAWRAGVSAPQQRPPTVIAQVHASLDRTPLEVTRAALAPGYVGFYLVEVQLPPLVNVGSSELYIEVDGHESNKVRIYLEQ